MYHYTECGLSNIYLMNGVEKETVDGEEYTSIDDMGGLHITIAKAIIDGRSPLTHEEFKYLRVELNLSQKSLADRFDVSEQTIARYEKKQTQIPRTTDVSLRSLYMESLDNNSPVGYFLELLADTEAKEAAKEIKFEEVEQCWKMAV